MKELKYFRLEEDAKRTKWKLSCICVRFFIFFYFPVLCWQLRVRAYPIANGIEHHASYFYFIFFRSFYLIQLQTTLINKRTTRKHDGARYLIFIYYLYVCVCVNSIINLLVS